MMRFTQIVLPILFLLINPLPLFHSTKPQTPFEFTYCSTNEGNYTANSIYATNLGEVLSSLPFSGNGFGFYNSSIGQNTNKAYAIGLCRGDLTPDDCGICLVDVSYLLTLACPFRREAVGWYQNCMLRFSNRALLGSMELFPSFSLWHGLEIALSSDMDAFNRKLRNLLKALRSKAAAGRDGSKFAAGSSRLKVAAPDSNHTIYAIVQCTPDLSRADCKRCLLQAFGYIPKCCFGNDAGRLVKPSCHLRYELFEFFYSPHRSSAAPTLPLPFSNVSPTHPSSDENTTIISKAEWTKNDRPWVLIISFYVLVVLVLIFLSSLVLFGCYLNFLESGRSTPRSILNAYKFSFNTIRKSTGNWANKLGEGGFGSVYKGRLNGEDIAVKRLSEKHGQGDKEFWTEVSFLVKLQHQNLVKLLGFSVKGKERLLVYEFLGNSSLDRWIFDQGRRVMLDGVKRLKIITSITQGLLYLHEDPSTRIIHRDLKPSNILLDAEFDPKIADFGMAKLFTDDQMQQFTTQVVGTRGYMAPEYMMHHRYSVKSDIYSLGVMILEIAFGEANNSSRFVNVDGNIVGLVSYALNKKRAGEMSDLVDPFMTGSRIEIERCIEIGLLCVQYNEALRPTTGAVLAMLTGTDTILDPVMQEPLEFDFGSSSAEEDSSNLVVGSQQPVDSNSDSVIPSAPVAPPTLQIEMIRNNNMPTVLNVNVITEFLGGLFTSTIAPASKVSNFILEILGWESLYAIRHPVETARYFFRELAS